MKMWLTLLLLFALTLPARAQSPVVVEDPQPVPEAPLARAVQAEATRAAATTQYGVSTVHTHRRSTLLLWAGLTAIAVGATMVTLSVTSQEQSDLSLEDPNTRLNRDLAPCGTDPARTPLPIADCKVNQPLLWTGLALAGAGGGAVIYGIGTESVYVAPMVAWRVKF